MPVGMDEVHPLLVAVAACGAVKEVISAGIGQVKERDEIILHGGFLSHKEAKLSVHGFELVANFIHGSILLQIGPAVKGVTGDFFGIGLVGFGRAEGIIAEIPDEDRIDSTDEDAGIGKPGSDGFVVPAGVLHADLGLPIKALDNVNERIDGGQGVWDIAGLHEDDIARPADGDGAFTFGNINTNSVHKKNSFKKK